MPPAVNGLKQCPRCGVVKPVSEYNSNKKYSDNLNPWCKSCKKQWSAEHYVANKEKRSKQIRDRKQINRDIIDAAKNKPCADCGIQYPSYVMDLDHRPGEIKLTRVAVMLGHTIETLVAEIAKCDVVCANCHRERTHTRLKEV